MPTLPCLPAIEMQSGPAPTASLIVLHGLGDSGEGWVPAVQALDLRGAGALRAVLPHAPERAVTINGGYVMPAWYDILGPGQPEDEAGLRTSMAQVHALIDRERERGVAAQRIVLMGFSQGCAMALLAGLRYPQRLAAVVGLSGYLPLADSTHAQASLANRDVPLLLCHGRQDDVVPLARGAWSRDVLARLGWVPQWREYDMGHEVCQTQLDELGAWLRQVLAAPGPGL